MIENKYESMGVWEYGNVFLNHILSGTLIPNKLIAD
jgi:hypothetical protein